MIDGSVLQSAQRCFEKKSRVVVKTVVTHFQNSYCLLLLFVLKCQDVWFLLDTSTEKSDDSRTEYIAAYVGNQSSSVKKRTSGIGLRKHRLCSH